MDPWPFKRVQVTAQKLEWASQHLGRYRPIRRLAVGASMEVRPLAMSVSTIFRSQSTRRTDS